MGLKTIDWKNNRIVLIDQTQLPKRLAYCSIDTLKDLFLAIKELKVRGAPALGAAAALGVYLGTKNSKAKTFPSFVKELEKVIDYLSQSRPTARNLFFGLERMREEAVRNKDKPVPLIKKIMRKEAYRIMGEDMVSCRAIGRYGVKLIRSGDRILTVCNAGKLATIDYGTALGVLYRASEEDKRVQVYACETRPVLQGARLTAWELKIAGVNVTLICDNMAAALMGQGKIDKVIAGADRIAVNGDTANKIGTYALAVLARYHRIPFYIAAPVSTFDSRIKRGKEIPIEQRDSSELTAQFLSRPMVLPGVEVYNPAFDVTPHHLISAIITDRGIIKPPYEENIGKILKRG